MFQEFHATSQPENGPARLSALRREMTTQGLDGFLVPRADAHQGEYVAPHDDRLTWLTGFTGSAGFCVALQNKAGVFIDGRYRVQVRQQVAAAFTPVHWPEVQLAEWLKSELHEGVIGFDPWLHTVQQIETLEAALAGSKLRLRACDNLIDRIWEDQPAPPLGKAIVQPVEFAGESHDTKRQRLAASLRVSGESDVVITLPDSLCWLLNIRGTDIPRNPVMHGFAVLHDDSSVTLFAQAEKVAHLSDHLAPDVTVKDPESLLGFLKKMTGPIRLEKSSCPVAIAATLKASGIDIRYGVDPCALPKARKNQAEVAGAIEAHDRDAAAVVNFLSWFDANAESGTTEIDVVTALEAKRQATNLLRDISFETIAGTGPNGAVIHYRVTHDSNRTLQSGEIMVLDSGGQYQDGTTDITRTFSIGPVGSEEKRAFTLVLKGMIAISCLRFPKGLAGRDIEAVGRVPLWSAGLDFDHGIGHGVGSYLSVHEGPQRLSRMSDVALEPGMILSNEPGYYREGAFGIRIENLIVVETAPTLTDGDAHRDMLRFKTLTYVPIDKRLIDVTLLTVPEKDWLDSYHAECFKRLEKRVEADALNWLKSATAPL